MVLATALGFSVLSPCAAPAADTPGIQFGVLGGASDGSSWRIRSVGLEVPLQGGKSWTARVGSISFKYRPLTVVPVHPPPLYSEDGSGALLGVGLRFYPGAESKGWYFSANLDYVSISVDRDWSDVFNDVHDHPDIDGFIPGVSGGYKAVFDNGLTFETSLYAGWLSVAGTGDLRVTGIGGLELALGMRF